MSEEALIGPAGEFVDLVSPHTEADPAALLFQLFVLFGNCVGRAPFYTVEANAHRANLFVAVVGNTAKARKGTSLGWVEELFSQASDFTFDWLTHSRQSGVVSGEGIIHAVRDGSGECDGTMPWSNRLMLIESEFAGLLKVAERHGNKLSPVIRDAWDSCNLQTLGKSDPDMATNAHISIIGHITIDELRKRLSNIEVSNGLANRFLWVFSDRPHLLADSSRPDEKVFKQYKKVLGKIVDRTKLFSKVVRSEGAANLWREVYPTLSRDRLGVSGAILARSEAQVTRLSLIYALLDRSETIEVEHLRAALACHRYVEESVYHIFGWSTGNSDADKLAAILATSGKWLGRTSISKAMNGNWESTRLDRALVLLLNQQLVKKRIKKQSVKGRPPILYKFMGPTVSQ